MLGAPIAHSRSPELHLAAYAVLGLDWDYARVEVDTSRLPAFLDSLDASWRGLSLTMPLKRDVVPLLDVVDPLVRSTGVANTVVMTEAGRRGANTDVHGVVAALADHGIVHVERACILGSGATAVSALVAIARLGATVVAVAAREPARAASLVRLGSELGVEVTLQRLAADSVGAGADLVVSTLPGPAAHEVAASIRPDTAAALFDVAYDPWPSPLASRWQAAGGPVVTGLELLLHQAVGQVRLFVGEDDARPLPDEPAVVAAMRAAVGL